MIISNDDLDTALILMTKMSSLFNRLEEKDRATLLRILAKRIIVNHEGKIISQELNHPFSYLQSLVEVVRKPDSNECGSDKNGSSFIQHRPQKSLDMPIEQFLASLRFAQRGKLDQLGVNIGSID